jgi:DNA-binding NtrC family response regulator
MRELYAHMRAALQGDVPVLVLGETGVGKELIARALHASGARRDGPFVAVNCAAIPAELLEAEMFGIAKGVATGVAERQGRFQLARGGTLFLDEIGDMPPPLQAKLLRAVEGGEVQPVGGAPVRLQARVVAATNSDLDGKIEEGRFRRDLYYRIAGFVLHVPPLRERQGDIPALAQSFLRDFTRDTGREAPRVTAEAFRTLCAYPWPGNVRELEHEVRRLACLCPDGEEADVGLLSERVLAVAAEPAAPPSCLRLDAHVDHVERRVIRAALARTRGNRRAASLLLGISRNGLAMKMERLGVRLPEVAEVETAADAC